MKDLKLFQTVKLPETFKEEVMESIRRRPPAWQRQAFAFSAAVFLVGGFFFLKQAAPPSQEPFPAVYADFLDTDLVADLVLAQ